MEKIAEYEKLSGADLNAVKVVLADETTRLLHGADCLANLHSTVASLFTGSTAANAGSDLQSLPQVQLTASDWMHQGTAPDSASKITVVDLLIKAGFATSKGEARRLIALGGARVNDCKVDDEKAVVTQLDFGADGRLKLSGSKKKHALIVNVSA